MEKSAWLALSQNRTHGQAVSDRNTIALLPANAGGGCSTVALNVAAALADRHAKKVLLIESDRRSGILSIMLDLKNRSGLSEALQQAGEMTPVEWQQHTVWVSGIHLLPANPARRGPLPTWAEYYHCGGGEIGPRYLYRVYAGGPVAQTGGTAERGAGSVPSAV